MVDSGGVTEHSGDDGDALPPPADGTGGTRPPGPRLHSSHPSAPGQDAPTAVPLRREYKGLTVADLWREDLVAKLPGQVRSALRHIQHGDWAAADRALPGDFAPVLPGPGHRRAEARRRRLLWWVVGVVLLALLLASLGCAA